MGDGINEVLVTGASGFIGRAVCDDLIRSGNLVRGLVRDKTRLPAGAAAFVCRDLLERDALRRAIDGTDVVVHCAGAAHARSPGSRGSAEIWRVNVEGSIAAFQEASAAGARRFIFISSVAAVCGSSSKLLTDASPSQPMGNYGAAKRAAEVALKSLTGQSRPELVILRPPMVYGPGMRGNPALLIRAIAAGIPLPFAGIANRRTLLFVGNLTACVRAAIAGDALDAEPYLVGDAEAVSTPQLVAALASGLGVRAKLFSLPRAVVRACGPSAAASLLPGAIRGLFCSLELDASRFAKATRFVPPFEVVEALERTGANHRASQ